PGQPPSAPLPYTTLFRSKGEEGRQALIRGDQKLTDPQWVEPFATLARWKDYLGDGFEAQSYPDSQNLFTLGRAAIFPSGSWEIRSEEHTSELQSRENIVC